MSAHGPIGIVIVTRDRRDGLLATLRRVTALPERPPVVVADNGSRDGTPEEVARTFPGVTVLRLGANRGAAARNDGARHLATRHVAFLDDDSWWAPGSLARAVELLDRHPRVALLAARVLVGEEERLDPACAAMAASPLSGSVDGLGPAVLGFVACGAVVRRDAFLAVGGFDARYGIGGEETRLAVELANAGWELRYAPDRVAHHHPSPSASRAGRTARMLRNDLWTTWSARPPADAVRASARMLRDGGWRRATVSGLIGAMRGVPWILRERRRTPPQVAAQLRLLERHGAAPCGKTRP
jgi:GT2 family glycosyltransferase